jgi:hypothetical protein
MSKFTQGPWKLADALPKAIVQASKNNGRFEENLLWLDSEGYPVFGNPDDAILCAAAPDMYEALCIALVAIAGKDEPEADKAICAALAKAEGNLGS